jgi:hypothetical protein
MYGLEEYVKSVRNKIVPMSDLFWSHYKGKSSININYNPH